MSGRATAYQAQITGRTGQAYIVNGVRFDGLAGNALLEAKGPGYESFLKGGQFQGWFTGQQGIIDQAKRPLGAAGGAPIQWHIAEKAAIPAFMQAFEDAGVTGIELIHTSLKP